MKNRKRTFLLILLIVVSSSIFFAACGKEPTKTSPATTGFDIVAKRVLIAEKNGSFQIDFHIRPAGAKIDKINIKSDDEKVAIVTLGAIDTEGNVVTASEMQSKKDELRKTDKDAAKKITIPTNSAVITANGYGECKITGDVDGFEDEVDVVVADKQIALTFDDGISSKTSALLKGLKKEHVKATFFVVGQMTKSDEKHIKTLKKAIKAGHEIGNHTYHHKSDAQTLKKELEKTDQLILEAGGQKTTLMRPPYGIINKATKKSDKSIILWNRDTKDWKYKDAKRIKKHILESEDGDIVLIHDLYETSVDGALSAIPELKKKGYYLVTVSELLVDPVSNKVYRKGEKNKLKTGIVE